MSNIKSKSAENYKAAILLSSDNNKMYSASIHCAYYACFQFVKHILCKKCYISYKQQEVDAKSDDTGSHNYVINVLGNDLTSKNEDDVYDLYDTNINELKRLRRKADYNNIIISPNEALKAVDFADELLKALKGVYKGL